MDSTEIFWGEMAPCEHLVQIYENDDAFLDKLEGFIASGLKAKDAVVVIATPAHLSSLHRRLLKRDPEFAAAMKSEQYLALDAEAMLSIFMIDGWPDEDLFNRFVTGVLSRAAVGGRRVRAFGEMVAILWAQGNSGATVRLEHLWQELCTERNLALFCAYPRCGFTLDSSQSIDDICAAHSRVIA
jgi:hypothetical protein